jgi:hypothetical protein
LNYTILADSALVISLVILTKLWEIITESVISEEEVIVRRSERILVGVEVWLEAVGAVSIHDRALARTEKHIAAGNVVHRHAWKRPSCEFLQRFTSLILKFGEVDPA